MVIKRKKRRKKQRKERKENAKEETKYSTTEKAGINNRQSSDSKLWTSVLRDPACVLGDRIESSGRSSTAVAGLRDF